MTKRFQNLCWTLLISLALTQPHQPIFLEALSPFSPVPSSVSLQTIDVSKWDKASGTDLVTVYLSEEEVNSLDDTLRRILRSDQRKKKVQELFSKQRPITGPGYKIQLTRKQLENLEAYLQDVQYYREDYGQPHQEGVVVVAFSYGANTGNHSVNTAIADKIKRTFLKDGQLRAPIYAQWEIADLLYKSITGEDEIDRDRQKSLNIFRVGEKGEGFYLNTILVAQLFRNRGRITRASFTCIGGIDLPMSAKIYDVLQSDDSSGTLLREELRQALNVKEDDRILNDIMGVIQQYNAFMEFMNDVSADDVDYAKTFVASQSWHADRCIQICENVRYGLGAENALEVIGGLFVDQFSPNDTQEWVRNVLQWILKEGPNYHHETRYNVFPALLERSF